MSDPRITTIKVSDNGHGVFRAWFQYQDENVDGFGYTLHTAVLNLLSKKGLKT